MPSPQESAHEQLRIIRNLMERATIYRSISAFTAFVGGLLSVIACVGIAIASAVGSDVTTMDFLIVWLSVMFLTGLSSLWSLWSGSKSRNEPFFSAGMKLASISVAPSLLTAATLSIYVWRLAYPYDIVPFWIAIYGVALLSTQHFAPTSIVFLGWSFVVTGIVLALLNALDILISSSTALTPSVIMASTFGLFHLIYAGAVWLNGGDRTAGRQEGADV